MPWLIIPVWERQSHSVVTLRSVFFSPCPKIDISTYCTYNFDKMAKFIKSGKVAVVVRGRYAGKKVVIVKPHDEGSKSHPFPHAIVAGVERQPLKVTKTMGAKKVAKRTKVKPFVKVVNYNHLMPTRYTFDVESFKSVVTSDAVSEPSQREEAKKVVKKAFEERHQSGKNKWFFTKLAF